MVEYIDDSFDGEPMILCFVIAMLFGTFAYLLAVVVTAYDGIASLILQPIIGVVFTGIACVALLIIGSPLLIPKVREHWELLSWLPRLLIVVGMVAMIASWLPSLRAQVWNPEIEKMVETLNPALFIGGWLMTLFGILWFPEKRRARTSSVG